MLCIVTTTAAFPQGARTPTELLERVFTAFERNDEYTLKRLAVSKSEFKKFIWPRLSTAAVVKLSRNADAFFSGYARDTDRDIACALRDFGGRKWDMVEVEPLTAEPHPVRNGRFRSYSGPFIRIRDTDGRQRLVRVVGGILEFGGRYKVSTYSLVPDHHGAVLVTAVP